MEYLDLNRKKLQDKGKGSKKDVSDTGVINNEGVSINDDQEDSFQKLYSRELDLD